ncbi:hypothetical protein RND81_13G196900 [Saponaria officinalis]|uniref:Uncharacterized protein n=1 Tax=Saponaria officinalis TaxID=3572 RepID=A0AAW1H4C2_SAPOF
MEFIDILKHVHDQCIANKQELEILLVFLPILDKPKLYYEQLLESADCIKSWFSFPYDNKVCRRLWRVFGQQMMDDRFIILPPNCQSGELTGRSVVQYFRYRHIPAYPFTRSAILEQRFATLKSITAASLFKGTSETHTCLVQNGTLIPRSAIKGKKLLLYFDEIDSSLLPSGDKGELFRLLLEHYPEIQAMCCEVVFIPFNRRIEKPGLHVQLAKMPWPIMPVEAAAESWVTNKLLVWYDTFECGYPSQLIAFGEDGVILSIQAKKRLMKYGATDALFRDKLRNDITKELDLLENVDDEIH